MNDPVGERAPNVHRLAAGDLVCDGVCLTLCGGVGVADATEPHRRLRTAAVLRLHDVGELVCDLGLAGRHRGERDLVSLRCRLGAEARHLDLLA
jgi:hypothetical protein